MQFEIRFSLKITLSIHQFLYKFLKCKAKTGWKLNTIFMIFKKYK